MFVGFHLFVVMFAPFLFAFLAVGVFNAPFVFFLYAGFCRTVFLSHRVPPDTAVPFLSCAPLKHTGHKVTSD